MKFRKSDQSRRGIENDESFVSGDFTETSALTQSSHNRAVSPHASNQTGTTAEYRGFNSEAPSSGPTNFDTESTERLVGKNKYPVEKIRLMPVKVKDVMEIVKNNPVYQSGSPILIAMKENEIEQVLSLRQGRGSHQSDSPPSGISMRERLVSTTSPMLIESGQKLSKELSHNTQSKLKKPSQDRGPPFGGNRQQQQVFAATNFPNNFKTDIQAYPMIGEQKFKADTDTLAESPPRGRRVARSRRRIRSRRPRSRRPPPRSRSIRRRPRTPIRVIRGRSPRRSPMVILQRDDRCSPFPLCENECDIRDPCGVPDRYRTRARSPPPNRRVVRTRPSRLIGMRRTPSRAARIGPLRADSTPVIRAHSRLDLDCTCNLCVEKLQFIQPSICAKKKYIWTNEYAIIPKPQINLIDPCQDLDRDIYPLADNPCLRDGRGNPLTDCIGRPLRDPIGKKFLRFNANGSVMETNVRGNAFTGQPPLCVKCEMPGRSCYPDNTHNWWMSCGYPILPNMDPFFKPVVADEHRQARW